MRVACISINYLQAGFTKMDGTIQNNLIVQSIIKDRRFRVKPYYYLIKLVMEGVPCIFNPTINLVIFLCNLPLFQCIFHSGGLRPLQQNNNSSLDPKCSKTVCCTHHPYYIVVTLMQPLIFKTRSNH